MATRNVVKAVEDWNADILPDDRHDKYCRMAVSPFTFYRGSNHLFWKDFSKDPRLERFGNQKTRTWLQGDMHAENMGVFDNDREEVVYGINDFDDSVIADYQFDVWRMAASLALVGRQNGLTEQEQEDVTDVFGDTYLETLISYAGNQKALHTYFTKDNTCKTLSKFLKQVEKERTRKLMLKKWTSTGKGRRFFSLSERMDPFSVKADPPIRVTEKLAPVSASERTAILDAIPDFRKTLATHCKHKKSHTEVKDVAQRLLAGTGSLGTPRYYVLLRGKKKNNDDRILDVKLQTRPSAYFFFTADRKKEFDKCFPNAGEIHASAYRSLTTVRDKKGNAIHAEPIA